MKRIFLLLGTALLFISCRQDAPNEEEFRLSGTEFDVNASGETIRVDITTNTTFDIEMPHADWISLSDKTVW